MDEPSNTPLFAPSAPQPFHEIWLKAISKPSEQTFAEIARAPDANPNKAYAWLGLSYFISMIIVMLGVLLSTASQFGDMGSALGGSAIALICGVPLAAILGVLFFALEIAITQWVAKMFKGTGSYAQLIYAVAAFTAPIMLVSSVISALSLIPIVGLCFSIFSVGISIYSLVLMVMAVKGVNQFGWGEALGSVFLPGIIIAFVCGCLTIGLLTALGPMIGDVFSTINQSLGQ